MEIKTELKGTILNVYVTGRLDTNTAPELESSLKDSMGEIKEMDLFFNELDYISSAGLRVILIFHKAMNANGGKLLVHSPKDEVMEVFDMTGFSTFLNIVE